MILVKLLNALLDLSDHLVVLIAVRLGRLGLLRMQNKEHEKRQNNVKIFDFIKNLMLKIIDMNV